MDETNRNKNWGITNMSLVVSKVSLIYKVIELDFL